MTPRDGAKSDLQAFFELDRLCFPPGIAYAIDEMRYFITSPRAVSIVAEDGGKLAGFVMAERTRERGRTGGHVITIDVAPEFRRQGVGRLLMAELDRRLVAAGVDWLRLEVAVDNRTAIAFYSRLGFEATGKLRAYYPGNIDAITMRKPLGHPERP